MVLSTRARVQAHWLSSVLAVPEGVPKAMNHSARIVTNRQIGLLWDRDVIEPRELFFPPCVRHEELFTTCDHARKLGDRLA